MNCNHNLFKIKQALPIQNLPTSKIKPQNPSILQKIASLFKVNPDFSHRNFQKSNCKIVKRASPTQPPPTSKPPPQKTLQPHIKPYPSQPQILQPNETAIQDNYLPTYLLQYQVKTSTPRKSLNMDQPLAQPPLPTHSLPSQKKTQIPTSIPSLHIPSHPPHPLKNHKTIKPYKPYPLQSPNPPISQSPNLPISRSPN